MATERQSRSYADLLGKHVSVSTWSGWKLNGKIVGYCPEPSVIIEDPEGRRVTLAVSVLKEMPTITVEQT